MLGYLDKQFGDRASKGDKSNLGHMRNEVARLEALLAEQKERTAGTTDDEKVEDRGSEDETNSDVSNRLPLIFVGRKRKTSWKILLKE